MIELRLQFDVAQTARCPYLQMRWLEIWIRLADEKRRHAGSTTSETSLDWNRRRSKCLHQCSTCRCPSTGTSQVRTTNRATPAATASAGCTSGSSLRTESSSGHPG